MRERSLANERRALCVGIGILKNVNIPVPILLNVSGSINGYFSTFTPRIHRQHV